MYGTVIAFDGRYFTVNCPAAPAHFQWVHLTAGQMAGAQVGDNVRLEYQYVARSGLWNVVEILLPGERGTAL